MPMRRYQPLPQHPLASHGPCRLTQPVAARATLDSPALDVMTDLARVPAVSIHRGASLDAANGYMIARGVRSLFVLDDSGAVAGLITATDILGDRAMRIAQARGSARGELVVSDVMTPVSQVVAFSWRDVAAAKVGHIIASMQQASRHHALVAETLQDGAERVRGIFSVTEIARHLGEPVQIPEIATTFAEVERVLAPRL
ncbi:MAG TPA: CBS domain-containing protein [Casimicrobiaceae bacterium]|nr:CBS domain-containing protein [Casimicrobiaceae bacterium]